MNITIDSTPLLSELFKTQAAIIAYAKTTLNKEQMDTFNKEYLASLKNVILKFVEAFPHQVSGKDELLASLDSLS